MGLQASLYPRREGIAAMRILVIAAAVLALMAASAQAQMGGGGRRGGNEGPKTDNNKPKEDDPKIATVQTSASDESVAQEATARQKIEGAQQADTPTVVHQGIGKDAQKLLAKWRGQLSAYLNLHKRYPEVKTTKETKVKVGFELDRLGHVVSMHVIEGSGDAAYDEAALAMIRRSDPVPQPPAMEADDGLNFTLDVIFPKGKS